ncbi:hypothetical protein Tco_1259660 [Tanacetum coccineum]
MPTEMELTLEQTQQSVSYEVSLFKDGGGGIIVNESQERRSIESFSRQPFKKGMSMSVQKSQVHKMAKFQDSKEICLVDDLKMLKITMSNTSSRNKLNPEINDHYNIFTGECQKDELKTKDKALYARLKVL